MPVTIFKDSDGFVYPSLGSFGVGHRNTKAPQQVYDLQATVRLKQWLKEEKKVEHVANLGCFSMSDSVKVGNSYTIYDIPPEGKWFDVDSFFYVSSLEEIKYVDFSRYVLEGIDGLEMLRMAVVTAGGLKPGESAPLVHYAGGMIGYVTLKDTGMYLFKFKPVGVFMQTKDIVRQRERTYGGFGRVAYISSYLRLEFKFTPSPPGSALTWVEIEAGILICHKIARLLCGSITNKDSWQDIAGYASLVPEWSEPAKLQDEEIDHEMFKVRETSEEPWSYFREKGVAGNDLEKELADKLLSVYRALLLTRAQRQKWEAIVEIAEASCELLDSNG